MYAEGMEEDKLASWVAAVQDLCYKDYQCVHKPAAREVRKRNLANSFVELESIGPFAKHMEQRRILSWWKKGMGYENSES